MELERPGSQMELSLQLDIRQTRWSVEARHVYSNG
jgi:hypothetical protein